MVWFELQTNRVVMESEDVGEFEKPRLGRKVAKSSAWSLSGQITVLLVSFLATPFTVRLLGPSAYGLLALFNSVIAYVTVIDLGMGSASTKFGSEAYAKGDTQAESAVVWTSTLLTFVPSAAAGAALWFAAPFIADHVFHVTGSLRVPALVAFRLAAIALVCRVLANVLNTPALVRLRWDLFTMITAGSAVVQIILIPIVVKLGGGIEGATGTITGMALVAVLLNLVVALALQREMRSPTIDRAMISPLLRYGSALLVGNILGLLLGNAERFILAADHSVQAVGYYSVAASLATVIAVLPVAIVQPLLPAFSRMNSLEDSAQVALLYRRSIKYIVAATVPIAVVLWSAGHDILRIWAGPTYASASLGALRVLSIGLIVNAAALVPYNLLLATGAARTIARCHLLEVPFYAAYAFVLVSKEGVIGAAAVWTIRSVLGTALIFGAARRRTSIGFLRQLWPVVLPALGLAIPAALSSGGAPRAVIYPVLVVALVGYLALIWRFVLDASEHAELTRALHLIGHAVRRASR